MRTIDIDILKEGDTVEILNEDITKIVKIHYNNEVEYSNGNIGRLEDITKIIN